MHIHAVRPEPLLLDALIVKRIPFSSLCSLAGRCDLLSGRISKIYVFPSPGSILLTIFSKKMRNHFLSIAARKSSIMFLLFDYINIALLSRNIEALVHGRFPD